MRSVRNKSSGNATSGKDPSASKIIERENNSNENKLEKVSQRLNDIMAANSQLRDKVDVLRKEKILLDGFELKS